MEILKSAIRYLRFSSEGQSNGSIERQDFITEGWTDSNQVQTVDTFIDRGHSAKTFDRPDFKKLQEFIAKHHRRVDYLVVDKMDRFSRDAGEALSLVKALQQKYQIQIVSVTEGIVFDYKTPGSYFRAGLQLLLAEDDNINRSNNIRAGMYTARAKEGRYVYNKPPFGYVKEGERKERGLVIKENEAKIVVFIYESYLSGVPIYKIREKSYELGLNRKGNMVIEKILKNPVYSGYQLVESYRNNPGGLFKGLHEPIIDLSTWQLVQSKFNKPKKVRVEIDEQIPLRGILKCHCGNVLTGAPSRGKSGKYYYYYKCKASKHINLSANKAHNQLLDTLELMSLPKTRIEQIRRGCRATLNTELQSNQSKLSEKKKQLLEAETGLLEVEKKWITNQVTRDTYDRWYTSYNNEILGLKGGIERLSKNKTKVFNILEKYLDMLGDLKLVYNQASTLKKREFINLVFDSNLYYKDGTYRTPTMMPIFYDNLLLMRNKGCLIYDRKGGDLTITPLSGVGGSRTTQI